MKRIAIIGGGISGLSIAYLLQKKHPDLPITIFEAEPHLGGKLASYHESGYTLEASANGFLDNRADTLKFIEEIGATGHLLKADQSSKRRFIYYGGKLREVYANPIKFLRSNLLSLRGKLRVMGEIFSKRRHVPEESLKEFGTRKIGREAFEKLIDAMASGIFAGNPEKMSLKSCFPKMYDMDETYGGLTKAMLTKMIKREKKRGGPAGPGGKLVSFENGMGQLIELIKNKLTCTIIHQRVETIARSKTGYEITAAGRQSMFNIVISASPAYEAATYLTTLDNQFTDILEQIPVASLSVVCLAFPINHMPNPGYGFLIPGIEKNELLGGLQSSVIFPPRAPKGHTLLQCMLGGDRHPETILRSDQDLTTYTLQQIKTITGISDTPDFVKVIRHPKGIPQYYVGHSEKLQKLDQIRSGYPGLYFTGNSLFGISLNDCISRAYQLVKDIHFS